MILNWDMMLLGQKNLQHQPVKGFNSAISRLNLSLLALMSTIRQCLLMRWGLCESNLLIQGHKESIFSSNTKLFKVLGSVVDG